MFALRGRLKFVSLFLAAVMTLLAQRDLSTLVGTVLDQQGAAIPNAKVKIKEDATGVSYDLVSGQGGEFARPALKPGVYSVEVEAAGFKKALQKNITLTAGDRTAVTMQLTLGNVNESVEVTADAPLLQTESTIIGTTVSGKQVSELPLGGQRTFSFLARLSPTVVPSEPGSRDAAGGGFSANGVRSNGQNNFLINGVDNNVNVIDFLNQTSFVVSPSVDAIGEFRVLTNGYNAEYGRGAGGVVNVIIKSGTNQIHGTVFEYLQNSALNANRWENNRAGQDKGPLKQNQFGVTFGAPIIKNKLFFFGDYQGTRIRSFGGSVPGLGTAFTATIPRPEYRNGDFSKLLTSTVAGKDALGNTAYVGQIFDPKSTTLVSPGVYSRTPFPGNIIPANRLDPAAVKIVSLFPAPNTNIVANGFNQNNYFTTTAGRSDTDQGDTRVDYNLSEKDTLYGSLSWSNNDQVNTPPLPGALDATYFSSAAATNLARNANLSYTRVWTPTILSETRVAFTRLKTTRTQANPNVDQFTAFGIKGYNPTTTNNGGLPSTNIDRYNGFGASDWLPSVEFNNVWDFIQNVSVNKGSHNFKFGGEYRIIRFPFFQFPSPHGNLTFQRTDTAAPRTAASPSLSNDTGDGYASFLLGQIWQGQISSTNYISSEKSAWGFYAQDDWKLSRKITLNLGVRYELFSPIAERFGRQSSLDFQTLTLLIPSGKDQNAPLPPNFATAFPQVKVSRGNVDKYLIPWDKTNIAPRIGIAYNAFNKTVFRAGYGIFYGGEENQGGYPNRGESVPFNSTVALNRAAVDDFTPNNYFTTFSNGFPTNVFSLPAPVGFRGVAQNYRNSIVHKWNFAIQREIGWGQSLELSYVGNTQGRGVIIWDPNSIVIGKTAAENIALLNRPYDSQRPQPNLGGLAFVDSFGKGHYNAFAAKLEKRFSNGLDYLAAYTYGHALANTGTTLSGSANFGPRDPNNYDAALSSAAWDIRHNFTLSFLYDLPFGRGKAFGNNVPKMLDLVAGGWQVNGILTFRTGSPFTLGTNNCVGRFGSCGPDVVAGKDPKNAPAGGRRPEKWFDTTAVTSPTPGTFGTLGLQSNNAPGDSNIDLSIFKQFSITERFKLQYRAESFNLFNKPQYLTPNATQGDPAFGTITGTKTGSERRFQMALRVSF